MSYHYQPEQPRNSGNLYPGWHPSGQYPSSYSTPMERNWSNSTGTSNPAAYSSDTGDRNYAFSSPVTPASGADSPVYYPEDTRGTATTSGNGETDWSSFYELVLPNDQRREAYWELQDRYEPTDAMPIRRSVEKQKKSGREVYPCTFPGCKTTKPFKRTADLQRHYTQLHAPPDPSSKYHCDYPRCSRASEPLGRKDHYRDHLRDYHGEDLVKRSKDKDGVKKGKSSGRDEEGGSRVNLSEKWWRCTKCLERRLVGEGWFCYGCKRACEEERVANRMRRGTTHNLSQQHQQQHSESREPEEPEYIKPEILSSSPISGYNSGSVAQARSQHSNSARRSSMSYQSSNACAYDCNNTWVYSEFTSAWEPCPTCQGDILSSKTGSYTFSNAFNDNDTTTYTSAPSTSTPASTWSDQPSHDLGTIEEVTYLHGSGNRDTTTNTHTTMEGYKSNCGHCSNYMIWDGSAWVNCNTCYSQATPTTSTSREDHSQRRSRPSHASSEKKKKSRRHSTWLGF